MADPIAEAVKAAIVDLLAVRFDDVTMKARFREDLNADSLDLVELVMRFEDEFGCEIADEDAMKMDRVGDVVEYLHRALGQG